MSTQEDRSLPSGGMSFPRWMKTKMNDKLDFEQSAFSPTELDDSFMFYYRNPPRGVSEPPQNLTTAKMETQQQPLTAPSGGHKPDFSKHTLSCQRFLQNPADSTAAQHVKFPASTAKTKSNGTDDGFKGEAAKCGSSVIRVAHQMVAGKVIRGFNLETQNDCVDGPPEGFNPSLRRGSKSLPASPLSSPHSSPKSTRRVNKYFTGPFVDTENPHGSWILSNLLAKRKNLSQSVGFIAEAEEKDLHKTESVDDLTDSKKKNQVFVAKPSELREMNFWSPTSM